MNKLNRIFLKKMAIYDLLLSLLFIGVGCFFIKFSAFFFLLGILCAFINLIINSLVNNLFLLKEGLIKTIIVVTSLLFRVSLVCIPGIILISYSKINFFIYIVGYTAQMISLVLYGFSLKNSEGKW